MRREGRKRRGRGRRGKRRGKGKRRSRWSKRKARMRRWGRRGGIGGEREGAGKGGGVVDVDRVR